MADADCALLAALIDALGRERVGMVLFGGVWPSLNEAECVAVEHLVKSAIRDRSRISNPAALLCFRLFCALWINGTMSEPPRCTYRPARRSSYC